MTDFVTFRLGGRAYATRIDDVHEVVRLADLVSLPGMQAPLAGVFDLRGTSLPVLDIRETPGGPGDVLVLQADGLDFGFACDAVIAVVSADDLLPEESEVASSGVLPSYVEGVLRGPSGAVYLVDIQAMAGNEAAALVRRASGRTSSQPSQT